MILGHSSGRVKGLICSNRKVEQVAARNDFSSGASQYVHRIAVTLLLSIVLAAVHSGSSAHDRWQAYPGHQTDLYQRLRR